MYILELHILTANLVQTEQFYTHVLGLQLAGKNESSVTFIAGSSTLTFTKADVQQPFYHFAFNIPANQIKQAQKWIEGKADILFVTATEQIADFTSWNAKAIYCNDPTGNIVELIARADLQNSTEVSFDGRAILSISEIGIPVHNLEYQVESLVKKHHFSYFSKQPGRSDFTVLGDDNGLLIFVPPGRNWFPTNTPAEQHLVKVTVSDNDQILNLSFNGQPDR